MYVGLYVCMYVCMCVAVLGQQTNIHRCTMDFYTKVGIVEVRGPSSHPKPLSILIKFGMCIAIWNSCIVIRGWVPVLIYLGPF